MSRNLLGGGRLQRKTLLVILTIVVVPMLVAGFIASAWVAKSFEERLQNWISEAAVSGQEWIRAYQDDGALIGRILADDAHFVSSLAAGPVRIPASVQRVADELEIDFIQVYTREHRLRYSSRGLTADIKWDSGQSQALLSINEGGLQRLATVSITPLNEGGATVSYVVVGSIIDRNFITELANLTGMETRLYYRNGTDWLSLATPSDTSQRLVLTSPQSRKQLLDKHQSIYTLNAEGGLYRGTYTPLLDSTGHMEAILFAGLERHGVQELLTNRAGLFVVIVLLGVAIGLLVGIWLGRVIIRPLEQLRRGVVQLAGRNYQTTVNVDSNDEFGELARAFNAMAQSLQQARDEEQRRFQQDKLMSLGELSASLAHEIRNPVGVINTASALLSRPEIGVERSTTLVRMIQQESQRVSEMVQAFLQLSRHRQPNFEQFDPLEPLHKALETTQLRASQLTVEWQVQHGECRVWADPALIQQAWVGLLANAVEAMDGAGVLHIASSCKGDYVVIALEDEGKGISAEVLPRLFEPFYSTKEKGTGIGLAIALTLVEICGGRLQVAEAKGRGACFEMWLCITQESQQ